MNHPTMHDSPRRQVQTALDRALGRLRSFAALAKRGEPEAVHQMRTASRRLRGELRLYRDVVEPAYAQELKDRLQVFAKALGAARDLDILQVRIREDSLGLATELGPLFDELQSRRTAALQGVRDFLEGEEFQTLLTRLGDARILDEADQLTQDDVMKRLAKIWRRFREPAHSLTPDSADPEYHEVRKRAKALRHAAEALTAELNEAESREAQDFIKALKKLLDLLGEHQDTVTARRTVAEIAREHPQDGPFNLAAGRLIERFDHSMGHSRWEFPRIWSRLDRKKRTGWFQS